MVAENHVDNVAPATDAQQQSVERPIEGLAPTTATKKRNAKRKPNYAQLHKDSLPLEVFPLPVFHPTHPLSLLQLIWTYLQQVVNPPSSHPVEEYVGQLSLESRSIHVTNPAHVRALWEKGFFGKGTLSRSEPTWLDRERARLAARNHGVMTAEEATKARREERRLFKLERARLEREKIDRQRLIEQGKQVDDGDTTQGEVKLSDPLSASVIIDQRPTAISTNEVAIDIGDAPVEPGDEEDIDDQEHLQLSTLR